LTVGSKKKRQTAYDSLACTLEPRADSFAERGHVCQHRLGTNTLLGQAAMLVALLRGSPVLLGDRSTPFG